MANSMETLQMEFMEKLLDEPQDITDELRIELSMQGELVVFCYNQAEVWQSRSRAAEFYREAVYACEGCEKERYMNVLLDILEGKTFCWDGVTDFLMMETAYR